MAVVVLALTGCAGADDEGERATAGGPSSAAPSAPSSPSAPPSGTGVPSPPPGTDLAGSETCNLVRRGIDAFNLGDLDATVETFADAVAVAEDLAEDEPSDATRYLLEAVRYYAALPAEDYQDANASDPEFARYKDFTLRECAYDVPPGGPATPEDTGIPA